MAWEFCRKHVSFFTVDSCNVQDDLRSRLMLKLLCRRLAKCFTGCKDRQTKKTDLIFQGWWVVGEPLVDEFLNKPVQYFHPQAVVHPMDDSKPTESLDLSQASAANTLSSYVHQKGERIQTFQYKRVEIFWPFPLLKVFTSCSRTSISCKNLHAVIQCCDEVHVPPPPTTINCIRLTLGPVHTGRRSRFPRKCRLCEHILLYA